ncbi:Copper amine oxidase N-terminal domain-containing protein [Aneurinibacillus thermoaerophilus]|uniref:Copper amine oxidase N-terminal domain-containing protein n=1 Tax=Aneurinibacillus thermoaerophilus TaxID=143495 RepID=A0A1G8DL58_ANETH|nr:copper amine oxidase N-terminal domain-containing protein [Aneurinibacillus thermoaerophilus]SDH58388.1 Copper amine oxidase N-terminal domain-containing protein [Aneurinibacillus thermoaerophilus]
MKTNKALKVLTTSALLASVAAPFGAGVVSANSTNLVDKRVQVGSNSEINGTSHLIVKEDDTKFGVSTGDTFRVELPAGTEWKFSDSEFYVDGSGNVYSSESSASPDTKAKVNVISSRTIEVRPLGNGFKSGDPDSKNAINIPLHVKVNGASGELKLKIDSMNSTVTSGEYVFATVNTGNTRAVVDTVRYIGKNGIGGQIRIDENFAGAISAGTHSLKLKLPSNFEWDDMSSGEIKFGGSFFGNAKVDGAIIGNGDNTLTIPVKISQSTSGATPGYIYITPKIKAKSDAAKGTDVTVNISGGDFSDADLTVAKYGDYDANIKVEKVEELVAGKFDEYTKTAKITIEESVPGSFYKDRDIDVKFPSWVKVVEVSDWSTSGVKANKPKNIDGTDDEFSIKIEEPTTKENTTPGKIEFKVRLSIDANKTGDIEATVSGGGIKEQKAVVAKAIAPAAVSVEGDTSKLKIGAQDQEGPTFYITEAKKGVFEKNVEGPSGNGEIIVRLASGVKFSKVPKVEVVEGDGTIDTSNVRRIENDNALAIPIKGESTSKPMKLKVSDVRLTLDRTVPEGDIEAKIGGSAVVENYVKDSKGWVGTGLYTGTDNKNPGTFNTQHAVTFKIGSTITPAPSDTTAKNIVFKLNSKTYTVDGKEIEMDAAPLVGWDRAYLPVRFAANALNVSDDQIIWDDKTSTFTIFKGDRVISGKVGDKFLTINGVKTPMDVPVWRNKEKTNNRVMVPIRYLANALNAEINWNKETSEITIQVK